MHRIALFFAALMMLSAPAFAASTFANLPDASIPLGPSDEAPLDQGSGCPGNALPCVTSRAPAIKFGQPLQTNCAAIAAPFSYQLCIDTSLSPPVLKDFIGGVFWPVATLDPAKGYLPLNTTGINGAGTINTIPKFTALTVVGNSGLTDDGLKVTIPTEALTLTGTASLSHIPAAQIIADLSSQVIEATAAVTGSTPEFLFSCGLTSSVGPTSNKSCGYFGVLGNAGSGPIWTITTFAQANTGFFGASKVMQGITTFLNDNDKDVLVSAQPVSFAAPYSVGYAISGNVRNGVTTFYNTAGFGVTGGSWQFGMIALGDINQAAFYEHTLSAVGLDVNGTHPVGVRVMNSPVSLDVTHAPDQRIILRGNANLTTGSAIVSESSNALSFEGLELQATEVRVTVGPLSSGFPTGAAAAQGDVNIHGLYRVDGVPGVTCSVVTAGATITVKAGIITALTGC